MQKRTEQSTDSDYWFPYMFANEIANLLQVKRATPEFKCRVACSWFEAMEHGRRSLIGRKNKAKTFLRNFLRDTDRHRPKGAEKEEERNIDQAILGRLLYLAAQAMNGIPLSRF